MNLNLDNKSVLITGASRGVGLAVAESFLQEGARTCLVSRGSSALYENEKNYKMFMA
jgi:3-oxoacyl-[acyl-carrier protein] reductase